MRECCGSFLAIRFPGRCYVGKVKQPNSVLKWFILVFFILICREFGFTHPQQVSSGPSLQGNVAFQKDLTLKTSVS